MLVFTRRLALVVAAIVLGTTTVVGAAALPPAPTVTPTAFAVGELHVDRYGDAPASTAVVLISGLAVGSWEWYGVVAHLLPAHRVYTVTLPGFDRTAAPSEPSGSLFAAAERDLTALFDREHLEHPAIVGHSLGGALAIAYAEHEPLRPRAVVSVDALPVVLGLAYLPPEERVHQGALAAAAFATVDAASYPAYARQNAATTGSLDPALMEQLIAKEQLSDHAAAVAWLKELLETDLRPGLAKLVAPLLVVVPYDLPDYSTPPSVQPPLVFTQAQKVAQYRSLLAGAPHLSVVPVEPARHFVQLDAPEKFDAVLDAFLAAHPTP